MELACFGDSGTLRSMIELLNESSCRSAIQCILKSLDGRLPKVAVLLGMSVLEGDFSERSALV